MFKGRKLIIATKHQKEKVIAPIIEQSLGVTCFVDENFDSDVLGTFTGEIERKLDPISTVREKCLLAMAAANCDLGIANEGSFGNHPSLFFANADDEFIILIDKKNKLEIIARNLSTDTNYNASEIKTEQELLNFANLVGFPNHGLILRKSKEDNTAIYKGIIKSEDLKKIFNKLKNKYGVVYAETDMRALYNPTRMKVIEEATRKLVDKINSCCPHCKKPGFGVINAKKGLPCELCGLPTNSTLSYIYCCEHCQFTKEELYPNKKNTEDPMYCNFCNP